MTFQVITQAILEFVKLHGYLFIFLSMILEGPVVTTLSAFAASLGYFNIFIIFLLSVLGNFVGDLFHFFAGRFLGKRALKNNQKKKTLIQKRLVLLEHKFKNHLGKTLLFLKLVPPTTSIGLVFIGSSRKITLKKFMLASLLASAPISLFYTLLGFFLGSTSSQFIKDIRLVQYFIFFLILSAAVAYWIVQKISRRVEAKEFQNKENHLNF